MDSAEGQAAPPLLVRRAAPGDVPRVAALLQDIPVDASEVASLVRRRGVLVLGDVTQPPTAPPVAAAAFRLDRPDATALLVGIGVRPAWRRRGLGRRLLTGGLTVLRAEGFERVEAFTEPGGALASLLQSADFVAADDAAQTADSRCFVLLL